MIKVTQLECNYDNIMSLINSDCDNLYYVYAKDFKENLWDGTSHRLPFQIVSMTTVKTLRKLLSSNEAIFFKVEDVQ